MYLSRLVLLVYKMESIVRVGDDGKRDRGREDADVAENYFDRPEVKYENAEHKPCCHDAGNEYFLAAEYPDTDHDLRPTPHIEQCCITHHSPEK